MQTATISRSQNTRNARKKKMMEPMEPKNREWVGGILLLAAGFLLLIINAPLTLSNRFREALANNWHLVAGGGLIIVVLGGFLAATRTPRRGGVGQKK